MAYTGQTFILRKHDGSALWFYGNSGQRLESIAVSLEFHQIPPKLMYGEIELEARRIGPATWELKADDVARKLAGIPLWGSNQPNELAVMQNVLAGANWLTTLQSSELAVVGPVPVGAQDYDLIAHFDCRFKDVGRDAAGPSLKHIVAARKTFLMLDFSQHALMDCLGGTESPPRSRLDAFRDRLKIHQKDYFTELLNSFPKAETLGKLRTELVKRARTRWQNWKIGGNGAIGGNLGDNDALVEPVKALLQLLRAILEDVHQATDPSIRIKDMQRSILMFACGFARFPDSTPAEDAEGDLTEIAIRAFNAEADSMAFAELAELCDLANHDELGLDDQNKKFWNDLLPAMVLGIHALCRTYTGLPAAWQLGGRTVEDGEYGSMDIGYRVLEGALGASRDPRPTAAELERYLKRADHLTKHNVKGESNSHLYSLWGALLWSHLVMQGSGEW